MSSSTSILTLIWALTGLIGFIKASRTENTQLAVFQENFLEMDDYTWPATKGMAEDVLVAYCQAYIDDDIIENAPKVTKAELGSVKVTCPDVKNSTLKEVESVICRTHLWSYDIIKSKKENCVYGLTRNIDDTYLIDSEVCNFK